MKMKKKQKTDQNWQRRFYSLLIVNISILILIVILFFWPVPNTEHSPSDTVTTDDSSEFVVRTTKKNLNELANAYIEKLLNNTNHHYKIILEEDVQLLGELPVFSTTVPLVIHLDPIVQDNGDVILKQKSISVGLLQLPNKKIMEYMSKYLPMPEWVTVNPKEEEIYVAVTDMKIKSNFHVSVEQFDLEANNLSFKIKVPYETLGIESTYDIEE
ncbi:YpmS family protein [Virgibacillus sp. W0181]|uniref:YpmS family protein n=1 Tax=Virgibacillus sp. W0181 TaxID=3391581 RepID=UPI003F46ADCA